MKRFSMILFMRLFPFLFILILYNTCVLNATTKINKKPLYHQDFSRRMYFPLVTRYMLRVLAWQGIEPRTCTHHIPQDLRWNRTNSQMCLSYIASAHSATCHNNRYSNLSYFIQQFGVIVYGNKFDCSLPIGTCRNCPDNDFSNSVWLPAINTMPCKCTINI